MKKVLLLTLVISMLVSSIAFAAPTVGHIFSLTENGKVYYYMFGSVDKTATDVGLTINGKDYNLDENALLKAQTSGKFGIGIADPNNILGEEFIATPYEVVNEERQTGETKNVIKSEVSDNDVIALDSLTVNGKAVAGFYTGTTETDFYYGLSEITSIESIPQVSYALSLGEATTSLTEEKGGYVYTISASREGRDGEIKEKEFKVHFREFAEVTVSVRPTIAYRNHYSYMNTTSDLCNLQETSGVTIGTDTKEDESSLNNTYLYFAYEVEPILGYAPVSFDLVGLKARWNPLNIYVYDGDLKDVNLPKTEEETEENKGLFAGNKGLNYADSFHLARCEVEKDNVWTQTGVVASSTAVSDGNNILIVKSEYPQIGSNPAYIIYGDWAGCYMNMNIKYVEKNPKDETDIDTTISTLTINGKDADGYKDNTYYVAVSDLATNDGITKEQIVATPTVDGATYEVSEIVDNQAIVTVTAKDGETTKDYTVKFKEMIETSLNWVPIEKWGTTTGCWFLYTADGAKYETGLHHTGTGYYAEYNKRALYMEYSTASLPIDSKIVGTANIRCSGASRNSLYIFYNTHYNTINGTCTFDEFTNGDANYLGEFQRTNATGSNLSITFDSSDIDIKDSGNIHIALVDGDAEGISKIDVIPTLTINYITLD